jgi:hypothetical protein
MELNRVCAWRHSGSKKTTLYVYVCLRVLAFPRRIRILNRVYVNVRNL